MSGYYPEKLRSMAAELHGKCNCDNEEHSVLLRRAAVEFDRLTAENASLKTELAALKSGVKPMSDSEIVAALNAGCVQGRRNWRMGVDRESGRSFFESRGGLLDDRLRIDAHEAERLAEAVWTDSSEGRKH